MFGSLLVEHLFSQLDGDGSGWLCHTSTSFISLAQVIVQLLISNNYPEQKDELIVAFRFQFESCIFADIKR